MSEAPAETQTNDAAEAPAQENGEQQPEPKPEIDWKAKAREWEKRAKENKGAADKLAEIEEANKTEAQKLTERAESAERELAELRTSALRAEVALDKGLTATQAKRLVGTTREELEADADEFLRDLGEQAKPRAPRPDRNQGRASGGTASTADQFAAALGGQLQP